MKHYFLNCTTVFEIKKKFRDLAMENHPDMGGDNDTMREILEQYHKALASVNGQVSMGEDGKEHTYTYNQDIESSVADKIQELLKLRMAGVEIALVGTWVWVSGDTRPHKDSLGKNGLGLRWHSKRKMWYFSPSPYRSRYNSRASFSDLAGKYGYKRYANEEDKALS